MIIQQDEHRTYIYPFEIEPSEYNAEFETALPNCAGIIIQKSQPAKLQLVNFYSPQLSIEEAEQLKTALTHAQQILIELQKEKL